MSKPPEVNVRQFTVTVDDEDIRLDRWFKRHVPETTFNLVSRWARTGQLRVDGKRATPGDHVHAGQLIRFPPADPAMKAAAKPVKERPRLSDEESEFAQEMVIHKDSAALVLNKPPGLATQGGTKTIEHVDGLLDALCYEAPARPKLVHRLDKDTSGVLLLARSAKAAAHFSKAFSSRTARKVYWALVIGVPEIYDGLIELPLTKQPGTGGEKMHVDMDEGLAAKTRYRVIDRIGNRAAWVELQPFTGRTHQLRVHMAAIGHPIVGDRKYGGPEAFLTGSVSRKMHLHARRLRIDLPDGGILDVSAELPGHMSKSLSELGFAMELGEMLEIDTPKRSETAEAKRRLAANIAKSARKERKGERRSRGSEVVAKGRTDNKGTAKKAATKGKAIAKQPTSRKPGMKNGLKRGPLSSRGKQK